MGQPYPPHLNPGDMETAAARLRLDASDYGPEDAAALERVATFLDAQASAQRQRNWTALGLGERPR